MWILDCFLPGIDDLEWRWVNVVIDKIEFVNRWLDHRLQCAIITVLTISLILIRLPHLIYKIIIRCLSWILIFADSVNAISTTSLNRRLLVYRLVTDFKVWHFGLTLHLSSLHVDYLMQGQLSLGRDKFRRWELSSTLCELTCKSLQVQVDCLSSLVIFFILFSVFRRHSCLYQGILKVWLVRDATCNELTSVRAPLWDVLVRLICWKSILSVVAVSPILNSRFLPW